MESNKIRGKAIRLAHENPALRDKILPLVKNATGKRVLTGAQRRDLVEAIQISRNLTAGDPLEKVKIDKLPGISKMQFEKYIDKLHKMQVALKKQKKDAEAVLKSIKASDAEYKKGKKLIEDAARELGVKAKLCGESEDTCIEISSFYKRQRPGIAQMLADPTDADWGEKAGDLYGRIASKLGAEVSAAVQVIYEACAEDLTHSSHTVSMGKLFAKTSSIHPTILKNAGILDGIGAFKDWLKGGVSGLTKRFLQFGGNIKQWAQGFVNRTKVVKKASDDMAKAAAKAEKGIDKILAH